MVSRPTSFMQVIFYLCCYHHTAILLTNSVLRHHIACIVSRKTCMVWHTASAVSLKHLMCFAADSTDVKDFRAKHGRDLYITDLDEYDRICKVGLRYICQKQFARY